MKTEYGREGYDKFTFRSVLTLIGCFLMMMINGILFAWGNMVTYVVGYYRNLGNDVDLYEFYIGFPLLIMTTTFFLPLGMSYSQKYPCYVYFYSLIKVGL